MTPDEMEKFERERRDADRRYNDALTAFDRAVVTAASQAAIARDDFDRLATPLIVFLQQITAFVETKDRELGAGLTSRLEGVERAIAALGELRTQIGILQRAVDMLKREVAVRPEQAASPDQQTHAAPQPRVVRQDDYKYVGFEDEFRGSDDDIRTRLGAYVPIFAGASLVVDVGCGRGEFLAALKDAGVQARGVDANHEMTAIARARGLDVTEGDALAYLEAVPDESLGGVMAAQVVEHLEPEYLMKLLDTVARKLRPRAPVVIETINPACWLAFFSSYLRDPTHVRPVHPETLQYLLRASGFERVDIRYSAAVPDHMKMKAIDLPTEVLAADDPTRVALARVAHTLNANAAILNNLMFTHMDYAAIGYRS
jgi:SAM-dependent methyltransferase